MSTSKFRDIKISLILIVTTLGVLAGADVTNDPSVTGKDPTYLSSFGYRLTDVGGAEQVDEIYESLRNDLMNNPKNNCFERAHVWAYQMLESKQVQSGKIFLFYGAGTGGTWNFNGMGWWFHVAPYVVSDGNEIVMEKIFDINTPLSMQDWLKKQSGGKNCMELTGIEESLLSWIPKNYSMPTTEAPCYYRKTPSSYHLPIDVYNHDIKHQNLSTQLTQNAVYSSCYYSINAFTKSDRKKKCTRFLQEPNAEL